MKYNNLIFIILCLIIFHSCKHEDDNKLLFLFNCSDSTFYYNNLNEFESYHINYYYNNLFVRSENSSGDINYINYDSKNRIIKEGNISDEGHIFTEYIYGAYDTISEIRKSDFTKYLLYYNEYRKKIESKFFVNNVLYNDEFYEYSYYDNVEIIRSYNNGGNQSFEFNINNCAEIPVNLDTILFYSLKYLSGTRIDSLFIFKNQNLFIKRIYKFNELNQPLLDEYNLFDENFTAQDRTIWEYNQFNQLSRVIYERKHSYYEQNNIYIERVFLYDQENENYRINVYCMPNILCEYILISREGNYIFKHNYSADDQFLDYSKNTIPCNESLMSEDLFDLHFERIDF